MIDDTNRTDDDDLDPAVRASLANLLDRAVEIDADPRVFWDSACGFIASCEPELTDEQVNDRLKGFLRSVAETGSPRLDA